MRGTVVKKLWRGYGRTAEGWKGGRLEGWKGRERVVGMYQKALQLRSVVRNAMTTPATRKESSALPTKLPTKRLALAIVTPRRLYC